MSTDNCVVKPQTILQLSNINATFLLDILTKLGEVIRHKTYTTFVSPFTTLVVNLWCFSITNQIIKVKRWLTFIPVSAPYI